MSSTVRCLKYAVLPRSSLYKPVAQIIRTPDAEATSAMKVTSRPMSIGHGSTKVSRPRSRTSLRRSTQFLSAALRSNFGAAQSSSHPAQPIRRCSCMRVVPSCSGLAVPVTVLIAFIAMRSLTGATAFQWAGADRDFRFFETRPAAALASNASCPSSRLTVRLGCLGVVVVAEERHEDDQHDADRDGAVSDVEDGVVEVVVVRAHEVDDAAAKRSIDQVAGSAAEDEREGDRIERDARRS